MKMTKKTSNCLITGNQINKILDFGMHPYADTFVTNEQLGLSEPVYPLEVFMNSEIGHFQVGCITNDYERYNLYSYSYTSSNSSFARKHWQKYFGTITDRFQTKNKFIIEIGSNDGYLLGMFLENSKVLGIDSSKEMVEISNNNGVKSIHKIFNSDVSDGVVESHGKCDLVIANNVFNHSNNPVDFVKGVSNLLIDDGIFVFELPYWLETVKSGKFDQIYHEHISYLTAKSAYSILKNSNLSIFDLEVVDYHGGSLRVYAKKTKDVSMAECVKNQIEMETNIGLFEESTYINWQKEIEIKRNKFLSKLLKIKKKNTECKIIGVGAAAKANTFLNYYRLDKSFIEYVTDSSAYKIGKYTPLSRIPIVSDGKFSEFDNVFALILSWNISSDLKKILKKINPKIKFINL